MILPLFATLSLVAAPPSESEKEVSATVIANSDLAYRCFRMARRSKASDDAIDVCTAAIAQSRSRMNKMASTVNRGVLHYNAAQYAKAERDFTAAIEVYETKEAKVFVNRGLTREQLAGNDARRTDAARRDYEEALILDPGNEVASARLRELAKPYLERRPVRQRTIT